MKQLLLYFTFLALLALVPGAVVRPAQAQAQDQDQDEAAPPEFKIVIHESNPTAELPGKTISRIFKKKSVRWEDWGDGKLLITPIDRERESKVRNAFSMAVHGRSASAIVSYWQRMIFSGHDIPPTTATSDQKVLSLIREDPSAIGYVAGDVTLEDGVKELKISN